MSEPVVSIPAAPATIAPSTEPAPPTPPAAPAAPTEPAKTPEQVAADAQAAEVAAAKQAKREELSQLAREKAAARKANAALKAEQAARAELERQRQADQDRVKRLEEYEAAAKDPAKWLEIANKAGVTAADIGKRILAEGTPEEVQARIEQIIQRRVEEAIGEYDKRQQSEREKHAATEQQRYAQAAERQFAEDIKANAPEYPVASVMLDAMPDYVMHHARRITQTAIADNRKRGVDVGDPDAWTDKDIAKALDEFLKPMHAKLSSATSAQPGSGVQAGTSGAAVAARAPSVTNAQAASVASLPANADKMSKAELEKHFADEYRKAIEAGRTT